MISIEKFTFNPFQENSYILHDETKECVVIDPGCYSPEEKATFVTARDKMKVWFSDKYGDKWLKKFEKAVAEAEAELIDRNNRVIGR